MTGTANPPPPPNADGSPGAWWGRPGDGPTDGLDREWLELVGLLVLNHYSIPDLSRHLSTSTTTLWRRVRMLEHWGYVRTLQDDEKGRANHRRCATGGLPSNNPPTMWGRGRSWSEISGEVLAVMDGQSPARAGARRGRWLNLHRVIMTCAVQEPPRMTAEATRRVVDGIAGQHAAPLWESRPWGQRGQTVHDGTRVVDGLTWRVRAWESARRGWTTVTFTLAADQGVRCDAGQVGPAAVAMLESALAVVYDWMRATGATLAPMPADDFLARIHSALGVEAPTQDFLGALPEHLRRWSTVDAEKVWTDSSPGQPELESHLPHAGVLAPMDEALALALKNPRLLNEMGTTQDAILERLDGLDAALREMAQVLSKHLPPDHPTVPLDGEDLDDFTGYE